MTSQPSAPLRRTLHFPGLRTGIAAATLAFAMSVMVPQQSAAEEAFVICDEQRALEQVLASNGDFMPDNCRMLRLSTLDTDQGRLCVAEFDETEDPGLVDRLTEAALPDTWWMRCADLRDAM